MESLQSNDAVLVVCDNDEKLNSLVEDLKRNVKNITSKNYQDVLNCTCLLIW